MDASGISLTTMKGLTLRRIYEQVANFGKDVEF